jgi:hypothetical protein
LTLYLYPFLVCTLIILTCFLLYREFTKRMYSSQAQRLSASGQELGGGLVFGRRLGFSGTPSDLLPVEMGRCRSETPFQLSLGFFFGANFDTV